MTTEGISWNWLYKDALPVKAKIPTFDVQGRKNLLSLVLGRPKFSSTQASQQQFTLFVFLSLARTSQFAKDLQSKQKTSVILSKHTHQIHVFTTCPSLEEFDKNTASVPSGINVWCDINGQVAESFGMKPMAPEENLDLFNDQIKTKYSKQTIAGFIVCIKDTIVKSPAYQPKLQVASISNIASAIQSLESVGFDMEKASASGTYASSLSERELQLSQSEAWAAYQKEYQTMREDLGLVEKKTVKKVPKQQGEKKTPVKKKTTKKTVKSTGKKKAKKVVDPKRLTPSGDLKSRL